ncbi:MAG: protein translocase subunit SecD, partial [Gammaproteobacteria bacterium]|nr:protein translocase subunit SecD [Gammaproteobacteria bacterium]
MAKSSGLVGERLLGMNKATHRPPNTSGLGRYLFIFFIIALGCVYAAPNLFQPDSALQIKGTSESVPVDQSVLELAVAVLERNDVSVKGAELTGSSVLIRVESNEDQLRGRDVLVPALGATDDYIVALNLAPTTPDWLQDLGAKPMSLGLDLSGGIHFLLQVDMEKFIGDRMENNQEGIRDLLRQDRVRYESIKLEGRQLVVTFPSEETRDAGEALISEQFLDYRILSRDVAGKASLSLTMLDDKVRELEDFAISQNLQSLRNRVNELGVSEPLVQRLGRSRIVLDLPGLQDSARAKEIINKFANLEFRLVAGPQARPSQTESFVYEGATRLLEKSNIVTGDQVTNAQQSYDQDTGLPQVSITLDNDGGRQMNEITKNNVGNSMAIIFKELKVRSRIVVEDGVEKTVNYTVEDSRVINIATIQSALGFRFRITGLELGEARDLALLLR